MACKIVIAVIGGNIADDENCQLAYEVGKNIAINDAVLLCGGLGGIMECAAKGAYENGGITVGILPGNDKSESNPYITIALPSGIGKARNVLIANSADVIIAFPGSFGTLSEISFALNAGKTVITMPGAWELNKLTNISLSVFKKAYSADSAVAMALGSIKK